MATATLPSLSSEDLAALQKRDEFLRPLWLLWERQSRPRPDQIIRETKEVCKLLKFWDALEAKDGVLYKKRMHAGEMCHQLLLPLALRSKVLVALHDQLGHQGVERTTKLIQRRCYWLGMAKDIEAHCRD